MKRNSEEIIKETFAMYEDGGKCPSVLKGNTVLHLYPAEDTIDSNGNLNGYYQCLFFNLVAFNDNKGKRTKYKIGKHDALFTENARVENVSVFKDGAFCIKLSGDHNFIDGQAATFYAKK